MRIRRNIAAVSAQLILFCAGLNGTANAVTPGQVDDFENGLTAGWSEGGPSPNPPTNVADGGPLGDGDNYLENISTGGFGSGSKQVMFNISTWTGDYISAGIAGIRMQVRVTGDNPAEIRVAFGSSMATQLASTVGVPVPNDGDWHDVILPIGPSDLTVLTGAASYEMAMSTVSEMRIMHSATPAWRPDGIAMTVGYDNITAVSFNYQGWAWETGVSHSPGLPGLEEELCFSKLDFSLADNDAWLAVSDDEVCYGRTTTNTVPARNYVNFDGASFEDVETYLTRSTRPTISAGGNLQELFGEDVEEGVGLGEERLGTFIAEPSDADLLLFSYYEEFRDPGFEEGYGGSVVVVKSTEAAKAARTEADLLGRWRTSFMGRFVSRSNVAVNTAFTGLESIDLQAGGACVFELPTVLPDPGIDSNADFYVSGQFDATNDLTDRGVAAMISDRSRSACSWQVDADGYLSIDFTETEFGMAPEAANLKFVVSDDDNYFTWAPDPGGVDDNPFSVRVGFRSPTALAADALDRTYLFFANVTDHEATGSGHTGGNTGTQLIDIFLRGEISFDSGVPGTVPDGQSGSWSSCNIDVVFNDLGYNADGVPASGTVTTNLEFESGIERLVGCSYKLEGDGSLLLALESEDAPGEPLEQTLLAGYVNHNGEVFTLVDFDSEPGPGDLENYGSVIQIIAMEYTGSPDGDEDADGDSNVNEFRAPVPPRPLETLVALPDLNSNGAPEVGIKVPGSDSVIIRDGSTDALLNEVNFGFDRAVDLAVLPNVTGAANPVLVMLQEQASGQVRAQLRDALTGAVTRNVFYGKAYAPIRMRVVDNYGGTADPELAVMAADDTDAIRIQVRDAGDAGFIDNIFLGTQGAGRDFVPVPDFSGNSAPEMGILSVLKGNNQVRAQVWDAAAAAFQGNVWFGKVYQPVKLVTMPDINGNGAEEIVGLGVDPDTLNIRVQVRDSDTAAILRSIFLGKVNKAVDMAVVNDTNGNGFPDLAILLETPDGNGRVRIQDSSTGAFIRNLFFTAVERPSAIAVLPDFNSNGFEELAALGRGNGVPRVIILDTDTGGQLNRIDFE